jgi:DUF1365 family protein
MNNPAIELCLGRVMHARLRPFIHRFVYRVFCLRLRIDQPVALAHANSWLFGVERARPVSFWSNDHGARDGSELMQWLNTQLKQSGLEFDLGAVWLQCFPRIFGYVFNPVSFWFIHDRQGNLRVLLAEVNNTFGQRHLYLLTSENLAPIDQNTILHCEKVFHVSPFCAVQGSYAFKLNARGTLKRMAIDYYDAPEQRTPLLRTALVIEPRAFSNFSLLKALVGMPMMTFGVMVRIYWQAFKLWRQGAVYHPVPALPAQDLTTNIKGDK